MDRHLDLLQRIQQRLQTVRQGDGRGGVGQQEGAGDQHQDPGHHENGPLKAAQSDGNDPEVHQHGAFLGEEQIQNTGKYQDQHQRLHAPDNGFYRDGGDFDGDDQEHQHNPIAAPALCQKQCHDVHHQHDQLGSGIQPVDNGIAREILA